MTTYEVVPTKVTPTIWCETFVAYPNTGSKILWDMANLMEKRHFEKIADDTVKLGLTCGQIMTQANLLRSTNPNFQFNRFLERCAKAYDKEGRTAMGARIRRMKYTRFNGGI